MFKKTSKSTEVIYKDESLPLIFINKLAMNKMKIYIDECDKEIGWLGNVSKHKNAYLIEDVMLFEQEVSATTTDIDDTDLNNFAQRTLEELGNDEGIKLLNSIKMWGHSHVNMGVFASGTDDASMDMFGESGHDYFIRLIGNKKGELKVDLYDYEKGIEFQNLPFHIMVSELEENITAQINNLEKQLEELRINEIKTIEEEIKSEMKLKLRDKVHSYGKGGTKVVYGKAQDIPVSSTCAQIGWDDYGQMSRYGYQDLSKRYQETYRVAGLELLEDEIWEIAGALNEDECRELLIEYGVYKNQPQAELMNIILACDEALMTSQI